MDKQLSRGVVELIGVHGADDGDVVGDGGEVREEVGHFLPALAVPGEFVGGSQELGGADDEGKALSLDQLGGNRLAVVLRELWLVVEEVRLGRGSGHVKVDHALARAGKCGGFTARGSAEGLVTGDVGKEIFVEQRREGDHAHAGSAVAEELAAGELKLLLLGGSHVVIPWSTFRRG